MKQETRPKFRGSTVSSWAWLLLVLGLGCSLGCRQEAANWKYAQAIELYRQGELDEAITQLQSALETDPGNHNVKLTLAGWLAENGQGDLGVSLCDELLEQLPEKEKTIRGQRATCYQYLGKFDQALSDYKASVAGETDLSSSELNNLAYFRALARQELPRAARQIHTAIQKVEASPWGDLKGISLPVRTLVSIGLVSRHVGQQGSIMSRLDDQIDLRIRAWNDSQRAQSLFFSSLDRRAGVSQVPLAMQEVELVLLLATRCLVAEDLGCLERVDQDRALIQSMGLELEPVFSRLPSVDSCLGTLEQAVVYLDTRGFVHSQMRWQSEEMHRWARQMMMLKPGLLSSYETALRDLDLAVDASRMLAKALDSDLFNRYDIRRGVIESKRQVVVKYRAVLYYHRMQTHLKAKQRRLAKADKNSIIALGLKPDATLF